MLSHLKINTEISNTSNNYKKVSKNNRNTNSILVTI